MSIKSKISRYKISKIVECFILDLTATQTAHFTELNCKTINLWYKKFRLGIYKYQQKQFVQKVIGTFDVSVLGIYERNGRVYTEMLQSIRLLVLYEGE